MRVSWFHYVGKFLMRLLLLFFTRWQVTGRENIPSQGPVLIIANHINTADPPLLSVSIGRRVIFMAKEELFRSRIIGYFVRTFGSFAINRQRPDRQALRNAHRVLADGIALAMFPEGKRSHNAQLQTAFPGSALIATRDRSIPILPVGIHGTENIKGVFWLLSRPKITVNIGPPFYLPTTNGKLTRVELARLTGFMMRHIAELLPSEYRGIYSGQGNQKRED